MLWASVVVAQVADVAVVMAVATAREVTSSLELEVAAVLVATAVVVAAEDALVTAAVEEVEVVGAAGTGAGLHTISTTAVNKANRPAISPSVGGIRFDFHSHHSDQIGESEADVNIS